MLETDEKILKMVKRELDMKGLKISSYASLERARTDDSEVHGLGCDERVERVRPAIDITKRDSVGLTIACQKQNC